MSIGHNLSLRSIQIKFVTVFILAASSLLTTVRFTFPTSSILHADMLRYEGCT